MIEVSPWALVLGIISILGAISGAWWRIENRVEKAKQEALTSAAAAHALATLAVQDLAGHKLHVAEHYVTKIGMREQTEQIMAAISGVKGSIENLNHRLDRVIERQASGA